MPDTIEFSEATEADFALILDHLVESYMSFGESLDEAMAHGLQRLLAIRRAPDRLKAHPMRGTLRNDILPGVRHLTIDRAIYWFDVDEASHTVRILGVFFGGQDHVRHMLARLLGGSPSGGF